jgi:hypothetical protein
MTHDKNGNALHPGDRGTFTGTIRGFDERVKGTTAWILIGEGESRREFALNS